MALQNLFGDLALDATLVTIDTAIDSIDGKTPALGQALAASAVPVVLTAIQVTALTPPSAITGFATSAKQDTLLTELQLKADLTETQPVSIASMPSTPVTSADLTTLAGAVSATHMQVDVLSMPAGGSSLTDAELRATAVPVSVASIPSHAVTNAGTFAVQVPVITGIGHGVAVVTTAGTDVALAASTACKKVTIQAQTDNTSIIAVGGSGVDATIATGTGIVLNAGDAYEFEIDNLADVYIDSLISGDGVRFTYFT